MSMVLGKWVADGAITPSKLDATASYTMGNLVVGQDATISGSLDVVGSFSAGNLSATNLAISGILQTGGDTTVGGKLRVVSDSTLLGNLKVGGPSISANGMTLSGSLSATDGTFGVTSPIYLTYDGKIGIGTTSPSALLHVNGGNAVVSGYITAGNVYVPIGTVGIGTSPSVNSLEIATTAGSKINVYSNSYIDSANLTLSEKNSSQIQLQQYGASAPNAGAYGGIVGNGLGVLLHVSNTGSGFLIDEFRNTPMYFGTNNTVKMTITGAGRVGIGTTGPASKLHVWDSINSGPLNATVQNTLTDGDAGLLLQSGGGSFLRLSMPGTAFAAGLTNLTDNAVAQLTANNDNGLALYTYDAKPLYLGTNNTAYVTLNSAGKVGIGTTSGGPFSPTENLDIYQSMSNNIIALRTFSSSSGDTNILGFSKSHHASSSTPTVDGETLGQIRAAGVGSLPFSPAYGASINFTQDGAAGLTDIPTKITFTTYSDAGTPHAMTMDSSGNVGIGTTSPLALLDVRGGNAIVSGNVGIGTTSPTSKLHVYGTASSASLNVSVQNTATDGDAALLLSAGTSSPPSLRLFASGTGTASSFSNLSVGSLANVSAYNDNGLALYTIDAKPVYLGTNSNVNLTLDSGGDFFSNKPSSGNWKWSDSSSSTSMTGLDGGWTGQIQSMALGSLVFVRLNISGTANGSAFYFTLPTGLSASESAGMTVGGVVSFNFDGTGVETYGHVNVTNASPPVVYVYWDSLQSAWTDAGGPRGVRGCFTYHRTIPSF
jgi:hypothetical protein